MRRVGETLESLEHVVVSRKSQPNLESYTSRLFSGGFEKIGEKVTEEAGELVAAAKTESAERVVSEAADLLYHMLVLLAFREVPLAQVEDELARRFGISGLEEKASRKARAPGVPQANGGELT